MKTVRKVRSLKEPTLPGMDYPGKLAENVAKQLSAKPAVKNKNGLGLLQRQRWLQWSHWYLH